MNADYQPPVEELVFVGSGPQEQCTMIAILNDDDDLEETESFLVFISSNVSQGVILEPDHTLVFIANPEGELIIKNSLPSVQLFSLLPDIIVGLSDSSYTLAEGSSVQLCAILVNGEQIILQSDIELTMRTVANGSAEGTHICARGNK